MEDGKQRKGRKFAETKCRRIEDPPGKRRRKDGEQRRETEERSNISHSRIAWLPPALSEKQSKHFLPEERINVKFPCFKKMRR